MKRINKEILKQIGVILLLSLLASVLGIIGSMIVILMFNARPLADMFEWERIIMKMLSDVVIILIVYLCSRWILFFERKEVLKNKQLVSIVGGGSFLLAYCAYSLLLFIGITFGEITPAMIITRILLTIWFLPICLYIIINRSKVSLKRFKLKL